MSGPLLMLYFERIDLLGHYPPEKDEAGQAAWDKIVNDIDKRIATGIAEAISRRDELAPLGPRRAAHFSWRAAAEATAAVYRELA